MKFLYFVLSVQILIISVELLYCISDYAVVGSWLCVARIALCLFLMVSCVRKWAGWSKTVIWMQVAWIAGCIYLCLLAKDDLLTTVGKRTAESLVGKRTTFIAYMKKKTMDAWSTNFNLPYLNLLLVALLSGEIIISSISIIAFAVCYKSHFHSRTATIPMTVFVPTDSSKSPQIFYDNKKFPVYKQQRESVPVIVEMEKFNELENNQSSSSKGG